METIEACFDHLIRENPMGEARKDALKLDFYGTKVTSDAGLLAYRELDDAPGLTTMTDSELCDNRTGKNTQHSIAALRGQSSSAKAAEADYPRYGQFCQPDLWQPGAGTSAQWECP